ncbi:MAG: asparagine synthase-related protein [Thermoplasmataceae archaeon]
MDSSGCENPLSRELAEILRETIPGIIPPDSALGFSGGIDSSLLNFIMGNRLHPYNVSVPGSRDFSNATMVSERLKFTFTHINPSGLDIKKYRDMVFDADPGISESDIGYEVVLAVLLDSIKEDYLVTGQGSDEIFYGYRRFMDNPDLSNEAHMAKLYASTLPREKKLASALGKKLITPYLSPGIVKMMEGVRRESNIRGNVNKYVLRQAAVCLGYPIDLAMIPKKAAQYGSGIQKLIRH